jgi:hypothetical protein
MKSYKFFLPLLAVLMLLSASSVLAETHERFVGNFSGVPKWNPATPVVGEIGDNLKVTNQCNYPVYVKFKDDAGVEIPGAGFWVPANSSVTNLIPAAAGWACVSLSPTDRAEDCLSAAGSSIPTLSEWAMIVFSVLLLGMMTYYVVRRRRVAHSAAM